MHDSARMKAIEVAAVGGLILVGCAADRSRDWVPSRPQQNASVDSKPNGDPEHLAQIGRDYVTWPPAVELSPPGTCFVPPQQVYLGSPVPQSPHADQLCISYSPNRRIRHWREPRRQPAGQVIVQAAYRPEEVVDVMSARESLAVEGAGTLIHRQGRTWRRGERSALFVMIKGDEADPNTDAGWTYAELSPDGSQVRQSGRLASCMSCHADAPHDRLFGDQR